MSQDEEIANALRNVTFTLKKNDNYKYVLLINNVIQLYNIYLFKDTT